MLDLGYQIAGFYDADVVLDIIQKNANVQKISIDGNTMFMALASKPIRNCSQDLAAALWKAGERNFNLKNKYGKTAGEIAHDNQDFGLETTLQTLSQLP